MNEKCKYCDYVSKCSRICEYNSILCKIQRSFPKVVDKSYEQLKQENKQLKEKVNKLEILIENLKLGVTLNQEQEDLLDEILFRESSRILLRYGSAVTTISGVR